MFSCILRRRGEEAETAEFINAKLQEQGLRKDDMSKIWVMDRKTCGPYKKWEEPERKVKMDNLIGSLERQKYILKKLWPNPSNS